MIEQIASPNCGPRRDGLRPSLIVVHFTAMKTAQAAIERLCDLAFEVSAHYVISNSGELTQLVPEEMRAWHAGAGRWHGQDDINSRSIGVELDNEGTHPFSEQQMHALETLLPRIMKRWGITPEGVIGHSDLAPGRKLIQVHGLIGHVWPCRDLPLIRPPRDVLPQSLQNWQHMRGMTFAYLQMTCCKPCACVGTNPLQALCVPRTTRFLNLDSGLTLQPIDEPPNKTHKTIARKAGWSRGWQQSRGKSGLHKAMVPGNARRG